MGDRDKKYDRQLRLWGDHGQQALELSCICLINATATGTEILKNLVLPGIGSFVIIDHSQVTAEDAGNNFFLNLDCIGESKAKITTEMLLELNPDVKGEYVEESAANLIEKNPQYFLNFTVVIVCGLANASTKKLANILWDANIPLFLCVSYGFLGLLRLAIKEHCVIESHPDNAHEDLRLDYPFPELINYVDSIDLDALNKKDHSHTPYLIIMLKLLQRWKLDHGGLFPRNYKEKKEFKSVIEAGKRRNDDGVAMEEENFDEALKQVNSALVPSSLPNEIRIILEDPKCLNLSENSSNFWLLVHGLRKFVENNENNLLPLRGSLPDMFSDSERYIKLQNLYQEKAARDMDLLMGYVSEACSSLGCGNGRLRERDIKRFCRNSHFLRLVRTRSIQNEYDSPSTSVINALSSDESSDALWYVMLRLVEQFYEANGVCPGMESDNIENDVSRLKHGLVEMLRSWGLAGATEAISDDYIQEICRYGAAEIHSIASYMGGVAAHEVIKMVTSQYVPINNCYVYNGLKSTSMMFKI